MEGIDGVFPRTISVWGLPLSDTVLQTWLVMAVLLGLAAIARPRLRVWNAERWQLVVEWLVEYVEDLMRNMGGVPEPEVISYLVTLIAFVAICNLLGLLPVMQAPTRDLNTTIALSMISLGSCYYFAIRKRGLGGWLKSFVDPVPFLAPLNIMSDVMRVVSMALRLFGNVIAGEMISAVMYMLVPLLAPLLLNALGAVTGVLQALVFTILTVVFILQSTALDDSGTEESSGVESSGDSTLGSPAA